MKTLTITFFLTIFGAMITNHSNAATNNDIIIGAKLFHEHCSECHGEGAQGQDTKSPYGGFNDQGERLAPALDGTAHSWHHSPKLLFRYIQQGSIDKSSPMPSYGEILSKKESLAIITYYQSLWPEKIRQKYFKRFKN
jgi:mono/diheme cytochrome c family protein